MTRLVRWGHIVAGPHRQAGRLARIAGYHDDRFRWTRLYVEAKRVGFLAAETAWLEGRDARRKGAPCSCSDCRQEVAC